MSSNRVGRNPFDKKPNAAKAAKTEAPASGPAAKSTETATARSAQEEQIIGELIELPEENWQPLTVMPTDFLKQVFARWIS